MAPNSPPVSLLGLGQVTALVSKTCLVRFDNNKYSVNASAVGAPVDLHAYADRIVIRQRGASSPNTPAPSNAARRFSTLGITCRFSCASPALEEWRAVQGLGVAGSDRTRAAQA